MIRSNPMHFVTTLCYVSTQKESCSYRCTVNDIDNMSDHLPLCMYIYLPVNIMYFNDSQYFMPKPKSSSAN